MYVNTYIVSRYPSDKEKQADAPDCVFVVDAGGDRGDVNRYAGLLKRCDGIVFTHGHFDHVSALSVLHGMFPEAPVAVHEKDAFYLGKHAVNWHLKDFSRLGLSDYVRNLLDAEGPLPEPDILLNEGMELPFAPEWKILHTPGHSPGSICLYNQKDKILISGDTLFADGFGRTDLCGGSYSELMESLNRLQKLPSGTVVMPGHGEYTYVE